MPRWAKVITDANRPKLLRMHKEGAKIALIATELEISETAVKKEVHRLTAAGLLKSRRTRIVGTMVHLKLSPDDHKKLRAGVRRKGSSAAAYLRYLIRLDNPTEN